jgi:hypothetical protein
MVQEDSFVKDFQGKVAVITGARTARCACRSRDLWIQAAKRACGRPRRLTAPDLRRLRGVLFKGRKLWTAISRSDNLRIADGSIMPRVTTGNTMAPCVIIGERAGEMLKAESISCDPELEIPTLRFELEFRDKNEIGLARSTLPYRFNPDRTRTMQRSPRPT